MKITPAPLEGLFIIEPTILTDERGFFYESFRLDKFREATGLRDIVFVQDNHSSSRRGVIRGLHFQLPPHGMSKLVRCISGAVLDFALDLRVGSPTYGQYFSIELNAQNCRQVFVPTGFAHGFITLEDAQIIYKCDTYYHAPSDSGIQFDDPALGIDLLFEPHERIFSAKDKALIRLADFDSPFRYHQFG